jgi:NAD(P)-dependent dehydrogenase (short-subunit alcohol dehydrogenase family)
MSNQLENKKIVIIGGTTGIGLSAAKASIHEGAQVMVSGRNEESAGEAKRILGENAESITADAIPFPLKWLNCFNRKK